MRSHTIGPQQKLKPPWGILHEDQRREFHEIRGEVAIVTSKHIPEREPVATPGVDPIASLTADKLVAIKGGAVLGSAAGMAPSQQELTARAAMGQTTKQATRARSKRKATPAPKPTISIAEQHTGPTMPTNPG